MPFTVAYAVDVAVARLARGDAEGAPGALWLGVRGAARVPEEATAILTACVRARRPLWRLALRVVLSGGGAGQRARAALAVLRAAAWLWQTRLELDAEPRAGGLPRAACTHWEATCRSGP